MIEVEIDDYVSGTFGESYLAQLQYESQIQLLAEKRTRLIAAIEKAGPSHPSISRAQTILDETDAELSDLRGAFLRAWKADNGPH